MNYLTIINNSGGNHGHQLKDMFGGLTIAKLYGFKYLHRSNDYLDFFALGYNEKKLSYLDLLLKQKTKIGETAWDGLDFDKAQLLFEPYKDKNNHLVVLEKATRIHPFQTIEWYKNGLIQKNVFEEISKETTQKFRAKHKGYNGYFNNEVVNVAMHVDRGVTYNKERWPEHFEHHENVRYMFPISYYENIFNQVTKLLGNKPYKFHIYAEKANSEEIIDAFSNNKDTEIHIGKDRHMELKNKKKGYEFVYDIFYHFVMSDILVASNSSFSAVVAYFRHEKPMIYHPHVHLSGLPETNYFATDENGDFAVERLSNFI